MGYPLDILSTRAKVKKGLYAVIPKDGLVNNVIPGIENCRVSIVASPKMGAGFVQYVIHGGAGAKTTQTFGTQSNVETFLFCASGKCEAVVAGQKYDISDGGYVYAPAGVGIDFAGTSEGPVELLLYKQIYIPTEFGQPRVYAGNINQIEYRIYDDMENVYIKDLLPTEIGFDMNMHILAFEPGGCHSFVETHVQEHGAYVLSGEGMYLLDEEWMPVKKDDFLWMGAYVAQAAYGVGRELFSYIYSKDCNRDVEL